MDNQTNSTPNLIATLDMLLEQIVEIEEKCKELHNLYDGLICWLDAETDVEV